MFDWSTCSVVESHPEILGGTFVFRGTRVPVSSLFQNIEDGARIDDFIEWFPSVSREQAVAVLDFAARSAAA